MSGKEASERIVKNGRSSWWVTAALFVLTLIFVIKIVMPQTVGEQARQIFLRDLQQHYSGLRVSIRRGHFDAQVGFVFEDVVIAEPGPTGVISKGRTILSIDRLIAFSDIDPSKLIDQESPFLPRRVAVEGAVVDVWLDEEGLPNVAQLWPPPQLGPSAPKIEVHQSRVRWLEGAARERPIELALDHAVSQKETQNAESTITNISFQGSAAFAESIRGAIRIAGDGRRVRVNAESVRLDTDLIDRLPQEMVTALGGVTDLDLAGDVQADVVDVAGNPLDYRLAVTCHSGQLSHQALPEVIRELRGRINATPAGIEILPSQFRFGSAFIQVREGNVTGYGKPIELSADVAAQGLELNERVAASLPNRIRGQWNRLQPRGSIDVDGSVSLRGTVFDANAIVQCRGVDVQYDRFPYPVQQLVGTIQLRDGQASAIALTGRTAGKAVHAAFRMPMRRDIRGERVFAFSTEGA
ncbi:MAG: hypothetical protein AAGA03_18370, partial [Planctomycetota bacterium]